MQDAALKMAVPMAPLEPGEVFGREGEFTVGLHCQIDEHDSASESA
jgi:hypothetical protein